MLAKPVIMEFCGVKLQACLAFLYNGGEKTFSRVLCRNYENILFVIVVAIEILKCTIDK